MLDDALGKARSQQKRGHESVPRTARSTARVKLSAALCSGFSNGGRTFWREVHPKQVCRKCAVLFEPICANPGFFDTSAERFRAGLITGKLLKRW